MHQALLISGFDVLYNKRDLAEAKKFWSPNHVQHTVHIETGKEALFSLVKSPPIGARWEHGILMAQGDHVMVHSRYTNPDGSAIVVVGTMRIKEGNWDVIQPKATEAESKSKRSTFGDKFRG